MELLINMTLGGTVTACLILLVKRVLKNKLTPKWHLYLWVILALRLMVPGLPESDFSLLNAVPTAQNFTAVQNPAPGYSEPTGVNHAGYLEGSVVIKSPVSGAEQKKSFSVPERGVNYIFAGWAAGAALMAAYTAVVYLLFSRKTRRLPVCTDAEILKIFQECKFEAGVKSKRLSIRMGGTTPMLLGIFKPVILIPEGYAENELRHVLIHELCHYKHKDILLNVIGAAFLCAYWFNPVLWYCFYQMRRDVEFLCDERVVEITGERKAYSMTLLKTAMKRNQYLFATTSMQNGEKEVAKRIRRIAGLKKPAVWISALAILILLATSMVCLTNASSSHTVNVEIGGGYYIKMPESWMGSGVSADTELLFTDKNGKSFGGAYYSQPQLGENKTENFENLESGGLLPNHSEVMERTLIKGDGYPLIFINLNMDSETAAQMEERKAAGDNSPSEKINQNYVFLLPDPTKDEVYTIWADSSRVTEKQLIKIARSLRQDPYPQGFQPQVAFGNSWTDTSSDLLKKYFRNYADADLPVTSSISGYHIDHLAGVKDQNNSWSVIYPDAAVFLVDYTLDIAYPEQYSFAGGGFDVGEGNKTKIYKNQLAVFKKDNMGNASFLGFVLPQDQEALGADRAVVHMIGYADPAQSPEALLKLKMPYIGDHIRVGKILGSFPLARYGAGIELHTKAEPYGLTVNYDLTAVGSKVFDPRPDKAKTDSSGWNPNPYLKAQLYKSSGILLSLIDNCSTVEFKITGMSEDGVPYTYYYLTDRESLTKEFSRDPRSYADNIESFSEYINKLGETE